MVSERNLIVFEKVVGEVSTPPEHPEIARDIAAVDDEKELPYYEVKIQALVEGREERACRT